ncbi:MAG: hypothetical protein HQK77_16160 [Desulfobacterales bacterium]|nr:hypothetical protein [Desulfobacterales bacterium]
MKTQNINNHLICLYLAFICLFVFNACGVKTSPQLPNSKQLLPIQNLTYRLSDGSVMLSWSDQENITSSQNDLGYAMYRYRQKKTEAICPNCPIHFQCIAKIPQSKIENRKSKLSDNTYVYEFTDTLTTGYHYIYMIRTYSDYSLESVNSNHIEFDY